MNCAFLPLPTRGWTLAVILALPAVSLRAAAPPSERFTVAYRLGFNISAEFSDNAGFPSAANIGPATGGGVSRDYDDGFNRVDITGNAGGRTWNWGYNDPSQLPGDGTVLMSSSSIQPAQASGAERDPHHGFELGYFRHCGNIGGARVGIEAAAGWMNIDLRESRTLTTATTRTVDAYSLGGIIAPVAPFAGTFAGPGPLIGDTPTRTVTSGTATINGLRELETQLFSFRIGPLIEIPLATNLTLNVSGGFAVAYADGEFSYSETALAAGAPPLTRAGGASGTDALVGGYLAGALAWQFTPRWSVFISGQYVHTGNFKVNGGERTATLKLGNGAFAAAGIGFSF